MSEKFKVDYITVTISQDDDPESPREFDNLGTMVCWHKRYSLGDGKPDCDASEFNPNDSSYAICLPLYLMDHSGISISTRSFRDMWDSGQVGWIFVTKEKLLKEWSRKKLSKKLLALAEKNLICEVETYNQYLTGEVYGYAISIENEDGETTDLDSCSGFFGYENCKKEAIESANHFVKSRLR